MFIAPGSPGWFTRRLTRELAQRISRNWWLLLVNGLLLAVAGVLIFSIDWSVRSLSVFVGALFIMQGVTIGLMPGFDRAARRTNILSGLASAAAGVAIIAWPQPGLQAVGIVLGAWLIVMGTLTISGSLAARHVLPDWWLWLIGGLLEVPLGVLALADPGVTLAALITVAGIWAVAIGVMRIVLAFELKRLPDRVDELESDLVANGHNSASARVLTRQTSGTAV